MHTKCQNPAKINKDRCFVAAVWKLNRVGDPSGPKVAALLSVPGFIARGSRTERFASGSSLHKSKCSSEDILQKEQQKIKISFACRKTKGTQCQSTLDPVKTLWLATTRCQTAAHSSTSMTDVCLEGLMLLYTEQWAQRAVWSMPLPSRVLGSLCPDGITCCLLHNLSLECASNVALWFKTHFILVDWSHW